MYETYWKIVSWVELSLTPQLALEVELGPANPPKWPFLIRIRYIYGHIVRLGSDIVPTGYPKHFVLTRTGVTNTQHKV